LFFLVPPPASPPPPPPFRDTLFDRDFFGGEAVLMMELPRRHSTPLEGGAGSHPLRVQTMVGVH
jgi:hypothetical protein